MGPRYCDHTFVLIKALENRGNEATRTVETMPAIVACMYCGQIRHVDEYGNVTIAVEEGKVIKKRNDQLNNTSQKVS